MSTPYLSTKQALADAAHLARRLDTPSCAIGTRARSGDEGEEYRARSGVQQQPDPERERFAVAVRAVLVTLGLDPDGEDAAMLYTWATSSDRGDATLDALSEVFGDRGAEARLRRIDTLAEQVHAALVAAEMVPKARKPVLIPVGYRVHQDAAGKRQVLTVVDPSPLDPSVYRGPGAELEARAVAARLREGEVVVAGRCPGTKVKHPALRGDIEAERAADPSKWPTLPELDAEISRRLRVVPRTARIIRSSWGPEYAGSMGRAATQTPTSGSEAALTASQATSIGRHIALARAWALPRTGSIPERLSVIEALAKLIADGSAGADAVTGAIRSHIHEQFEHVIDPAAGNAEQQAKLNAIHHGPSGTPVNRC